MLLIRGFRHTRCHEDYRNIKVPYTYGKVSLYDASTRGIAVKIYEGFSFNIF